jgi:hypothetical protein
MDCAQSDWCRFLVSEIACYPFGHLRDLIVYPWDILSCGMLVVFCGTRVDFRTCLVGPLNVLDCCVIKTHINASFSATRDLASGAADAVSTGGSYGRGSFPPVTRATVTSDMVAFPETDVGTWI